ncbi:MAG: hypothetical protein JKX69_05380, partial [Rhodobacteraceae bacterium]|nr:hypothetical protein [Paracoccaceae bacterium]
GIISSAAIVFAFTFGAYEIPALLGASHPLALPVLAWQRFNAPDLAARPEAMALALLIAALSGLVVWVVLRAGRAQRRLS